MNVIKWFVLVVVPTYEECRLTVKNDIFFSSRANRGPCFSFVHARVLFKCSNLRKGTPVIDHRLWICEVSEQKGGTAFGVQPWNFFNVNLMAFNGQPLGGPINLNMTFTDTCVSLAIETNETSV